MAEQMKEKNQQQEHVDVHYWRSFRELYRDPQLIEEKQREFQEGVTNDFTPDQLSQMSRRKFFALVGASAALAGAGCTDYREKGAVVPYNKQPEEILPGKPNFYASTCTACPNACGILIKTREGRPIKVDGNPDHPVSKGKICSKGQASILNLYDPARLRKPNRRNGNSFTSVAWQHVDEHIRSSINASVEGGKEIAIITHPVLSPTGKKLLDEFVQSYPGTKVYAYELFHEESRNNAWRRCYGSGTFPLLKWDEAKIVVSLESDFLGNEGNKIEQVRLFTDGRDIMKTATFNRLYTAESAMTLTGMNSDYRLRIRPDQQLEFVLSLLNEIVIQKGTGSVSLDASAVSIISQYSLSGFIETNGLPEKVVRYLVDDLIANKGYGIIHAGRSLSEDVHVAVNILNEALGNTALYVTSTKPVVHQTFSSKAEWLGLIEKMANGEVDILINYDSNPVYHLPSDYGFTDAVKHVPTVVTLSELDSETSHESHYVLPINHTFESWGDAQTRTGFYSLQQPVIAPLLDTRQKEEILLRWMPDAEATDDNLYHRYLLDHWENVIYTKVRRSVDFKTFWYAALHDGVITDRADSRSLSRVNAGALAGIEFPAAREGFTLILQESYFLGDGRFANNGWLQEIPHPVSKIAWDNYAAISDASAKKLSVKNNDLVKVEINGRSLNLPVFVQPGMADNTVAVMLGYGRTKTAVVADNVGFNANLLMSKDSRQSPWVYTGVTVTKARGTYRVVSTQEHHAFDVPLIQDIHYKRHIIQEGTLEKYNQNPDFLDEYKHDLFSITTQKEYTGVKWAMAIDMNKCIGCADCVTACNVENNVPVVGKDQVQVGREMHWIRIDRYYSGTPEEPKIAMQPMLCQHCDKAPCENVCPVVATTHSEDGLNQMVYNRCVGTRYCSNNCPYKVRRFNFFNFRDHFRRGYYRSELVELVNNPEVTVRSRGVMEKCTFCVQRISDARETATSEGRPLKGSDVRTACQDACNAEAIVFGDMNDPESKIAKYRDHNLGYVVLEELNVRPNVTYLAKLRNTHTEDK
jgi:MoCo/4Fe-4S cofactor protein with predicted Tat translocation signal